MTLNGPRWAVLVDMAYELGGAGLAGFVKFLAAARAGDWGAAAEELHRSKLYQQVPKRETENITILLSGAWPLGVSSDAELVQRHEGCVLAAAPDAKGKWAIGWGHDIPAPASSTEGEPLSRPTCSQEQADEWFEADLALARANAAAALGLAAKRESQHE